MFAYWFSLCVTGVLLNLFICGLVYWSLKLFPNYKIDTTETDPAIARTQLFESSITMVIYATVYVLSIAIFGNYQKIYFDVGSYGYLVLSYFLLVVVTDLYFVLAHWLMHSAKWLRQFHDSHHQYRSPTAWAGFAFHPVEAIILGGMMPLALMLIPVHINLLYVFLFIHLTLNAYCHSGYSMLSTHQWDKYEILNSSRRHFEHHSEGNKHLGLYLLLWGRALPR